MAAKLGHLLTERRPRPLAASGRCLLLLSLCCLIGLPAELSAQPSKKAKHSRAPAWLDTEPPRVEILPAKNYHASVFMVTLSANKRAVLYYGIGSPTRMQEYTTPISVTHDTSFTIYYYGEDDFGNRSAIDSMHYVLDSRVPRLTITPERGHYQNGVTVRFSTDKPCRFEYIRDPAQSLWRPIPDSIVVTGRLDGFVAAIDSMGNRTVSGRLKYIVDTSSFQVFCQPSGGLFNRPVKISFDAPDGVEVFYTFDPLAASEQFSPYLRPVQIPAGLSTLRYYGKNRYGKRSPVERERFILDMVPPRVHLRVLDGSDADTLRLSMKKEGVIRYTLDGTIPRKGSAEYAVDSVGTDMSTGLLIVVPHEGRGILRAIAWDKAGNESNMIEWERKYDFTAPSVRIDPDEKVDRKPFVATIETDERATVYYTTDGTKPTSRSLVYDKRGISISRQGETVLRFFAVDAAGNASEEKSAVYRLDMKPPTVRAQIDGSLELNNFTVRLTASKPATVHYEVGGKRPTPRSPVYSTPLPLRGGELLSYFAIDSLGNQSQVYVLDELKKPMVTASPNGGLFNKRVTVRFLSNVPGTVHWRLLPDTVFHSEQDTVPLATEGAHSLEYYLQSEQGLRSPLKRSEYFTDWSAPSVAISVRKASEDSVTIFFDCNENASIYYTIDGTNPIFSASTQVAGNKYSLSSDRITILRNVDVKLAFFAEDAFGNQGTLTIFDVLKPRVIPDIPHGKDRLYDRIISVTLNSSERSSIFYCRHGKTPTIDSTLFTDPITLLQSDTIVAFAIDAAGFRGELDTFVYRIDLPPSPHFTVSPDTIFSGMPVTLDATMTVDKESPTDDLLFQWDFDGDGRFDTKAGAYSRVSHTYEKPGAYKTTVRVTDTARRSGTAMRTVLVQHRCPDGMVTAAEPDGRTFCIDAYEYPNERGTLPQSGASWVEAKITCLDGGKRLCTRREWHAACQGHSRATYPYGETYDARRCPTEGKRIWRSRSFDRCESFGAYDMLGNVWEWVEDKHGDYPLMMGGSYRLGNYAHCGLATPSTLAARVDDAGFRCCK